MSTASLLYVNYIFTICPLYLHFIFTIGSLYVHYMFQFVASIQMLSATSDVETLTVLPNSFYMNVL